MRRRWPVIYLLIHRSFEALDLRTLKEYDINGHARSIKLLRACRSSACKKLDQK